MDALNKLSGTGDISNFLVGEDWDQDGDDLDDDYTSPIDDIDQLIFLSETLTSAFQKEPEVSFKCSHRLLSVLFNVFQHILSNYSFLPL